MPKPTKTVKIKALKPKTAKPLIAPQVSFNLDGLLLMTPSERAGWSKTTDLFLEFLDDKVDEKKMKQASGFAGSIVNAAKVRSQQAALTYKMAHGA